MLCGVLAGEWLRSARPSGAKVRGLALAGGLCLLGSTMLAPYAPIVKRIWSPGWVIFSTAWTCWLLAAFYCVVDVWKLRRWAFPLVVVGLNSIAMYLMAQLLKGYVARQLQLHGGTLVGWLHSAFGVPLDSSVFGTDLNNPKLFAGIYGPVIESASVLFVLWLVCLWMYRRKIFLRI
jgi:predicted acyltransferase